MFRRILFATALVSLTPACGDKSSLQKIQAPEGGVTLAYDFAPGQVYRGRVKNSETVRGTSGGSISRGFSFDVALTILGPDEAHGGSLITARFSNVDIRWALPPGMPFSVADIVAKAKTQLQDMEVDFAVDSAGKVVFMPELPPDMSAEQRFIVQEALDTLETAFLPVPARPLKPGDTWKDENKRGRPGKLGRYVDATTTTKVDGFYRVPEAGNEDVTRLVITESETEVTTAKTGSHEVKKEGSAEVQFAHVKKYLVALIRESTTFDPGISTTFTTLDVRWKKDGPNAGAAITPVKKVQTIEDPCHPDYVGGEDCKPSGEAVPDPAAPAGPAGEASPTKTPAP